MSRRCYVETLPDGRQQFVQIKRSKSYHHHRHSHVSDYYKISREEWKTLLDRNRALEEANQAYGSQNDSLRNSLSTAQAEAHHLSHAVVPQLQEQIVTLQVENQSLRRSLDNACGSPIRGGHDTDKLRHKINKLEEENKDLRVRVRELSKQLEQSFNRRVQDLQKEVDYWIGMHNFWKGKWEELREQHITILDVLDARTEKIEVYEKILKKRRVM
ncbi:Fc.00g002970.m01.CDS01 [Cosmosporella sp. VM-42]